MADRKPQSPPSAQRSLSISAANGSNVPLSALSPVSVAGSEWSGISGYTGNGGPPPRNGGGPNGMPNSPSRPSPPSSIARSSDGTGLYASSEGRNTMSKIVLEEEVAEHHTALKRMLQPYLSQKGAARPNKARDKLLRLSAIQFQELSTDVYDELQRRSAAERVSGPPDNHPPHLLPKEDFHPKRNHAREKLSTLPLVRFRDLATDVFYELERRFPKFNSGLISPTNSMDGRGMPPPRVGSPGMGNMPPPQRVGSPGMGPERRGSPGPPGPGGRGINGPRSPYGGPPGPNGFRGQPPRGPPGRGPPPMGPPGQDSPNSLGRPLPKTFQNNTIVPNKSTMVEDDDDDDDDAFGLDRRRNTGHSMASGAGNEATKRLITEYQQKVETLQDRVTALEAKLEEKESDLRRAHAANNNNHAKRDEWEDLRLDLEGKLADAESLNNSLRSEINKAKMDNANNERDLHDQIRDLQIQLQQAQSNQGQQMGDEDLRRQNEELKADLREQEEVTEEVRREAMEFLNQMKVISERADNSFEKEEQLNREIARLQDEVKDWKTRYAKAKTTIRSIRSSSLGLHVPSSGSLLGGKDANLVDPRGLIKAVHLTKFQITIDELLRVARGINFTQSLEQVKAVVLATRTMTQELEDRNSEEIARLKTRVSATANNLTTAAKNHAAGCGLSPVSLVDAAASHLTASVIELVKLVKIRPTKEGEIDEEDEYLAQDSAATTYIEDEAMDPTVRDINGKSFHNGPIYQGRMSNDSVYSFNDSSNTSTGWDRRQPHNDGGVGGGGGYDFPMPPNRTSRS